MPVPHTSENFADFLDPRFEEIFTEEAAQLPDMIPMLYNDVGTNGRVDMRWSEAGALSDWDPFEGTTEYDAFNQGYDVTMTPLEFVKGIQVERKLVDDNQFEDIFDRPRGLAQSYSRTRQGHAARPFNNGFSNDTFFSVRSEGVPLCSNGHTTTDADTSTGTGFDNLVTTALSATNLAASRIQFVGFRDDRANRMQTMPDEILIPPDLYEVAFEIVASMGKVDENTNNRNVHEGAYRIVEWNYLSDPNNWFLMDSAMRRRNLFWSDRIPVEFAMAEDIDTRVGKWAGYARYGNTPRGWRWILGAQVS